MVYKMSSVQSLPEPYGTFTVRKKTIKELKLLKPLRYCKCDGKVIFTRLFLMLGNLTFSEHVNEMEMYWKGDVLHTFTKPKWLSFQI